jgi:hypothetical protein
MLDCRVECRQLGFASGAGLPLRNRAGGYQQVRVLWSSERGTQNTRERAVRTLMRLSSAGGKSIVALTVCRVPPEGPPFICQM